MSLPSNRNSLIPILPQHNCPDLPNPNLSIKSIADPSQTIFMADRHTQNLRNQSGASVLRRLQDHTPTSSQLMGFLTLAVSGGILLLLTGATVTATALALIFLTPLIVVSSPIWIPAGFALFAAATAFLSLCGFGVCAVAGIAWLYRYVRGLHPPGADRVDHARSRVYDTASNVKDYAREYGGYLQTKAKDAAPGA